jgi:SAM domain (Sterile alpha motif)
VNLRTNTRAFSHRYDGKKLKQLKVDRSEIKAMLSVSAEMRKSQKMVLSFNHFSSKHDITGRSLLRLNDNSLKRMGIKNDTDRDAILKEILKQASLHKTF